MRILMVFPGRLGQLPPLQSAILSATELGAQVEVLVAHASPEERTRWASQGVSVHEVGPMPTALGRVQFLRKLARLVRLNPDVTWWHGVHAMRMGLLFRRASLGRIVAHAHEYYQEAIHRYLQDRFVNGADVLLAPERTRLVLLRAQSQSRARGFVVANRPHDRLLPPRANADAARSTVRSLFAGHPNGSPKRVLVYQGLIAPERCLAAALKGFSKVPDKEAGLIVVGEGPDRDYANLVASIARRDPRVVMRPNMPSPAHLEVTAGCDLGLMLYALNSVNNALCAPNKLFEYTQFGLGIAMPELPHLVNLPGAAGFGAYCEPEDAGSIAEALQTLLGRNPEIVRAGAAQFLRSQPTTADSYVPVMSALREIAGAPGSSAPVS